jgi:uncharacterized membrane protein (DUF4010 family)
MGAVMLAGAFERWRVLQREGTAPGAEIALSNPFSLIPALKWGALLAFILVVAAVMKEHFGNRGLVAVAAVSGLADVDAINLAVSRDAARGSVEPGLAVLAITVGAVANTVTKGIVAVSSGGPTFGRPIAIVFAIAIAAGVVAALV